MQNIYRRGRSWVTNVQVNGRRIRRAFRTKFEAQEAAGDLKHLGVSHRWNDTPKDISWSFFKLKYAELTASKKEQTRYRDKHSFEMLEECYAIKRLRQVTPELLEGMKGKLLENGYGKPAINRAISAIKAAMRRAESWKYIAPQTWRDVSPLQTPRSRLLFYDLKELSRLKSKCNGWWECGFMLGYEAGLRPSEKLKLRVSDVNWDLRKLHIFDSKGGKSRWIPMTPRLYAYLKKYKMGKEFVMGDDLPNEDVWSSYWRKLIQKKCKLKGAEYTLRHTFASHLAMAGVPLIQIAKMMGHSTARTTELYAHLSPESSDTAIQKLPQPA